jgi:hypothetical protein
VVPVPELESFVRGRWVHYEPDWVSRDPAFTHAHITALAPYLRKPTGADLARVGAVAAATAPFDYDLRDVRAFPDGCLHLAPDPAAPFAALTHALWVAFPQCPPYAGAYDVAPHLTLDHPGRNQVAGDPARVRLLADACVEGDDVGVTDDPGRLQGDQLGVPRADPDRGEAPAPGNHSASCASALTADDAIAEPPRRPRTVT